MCVREGTCAMELVELVLLFYHVDPSWQQASLPAVPTESSCQPYHYFFSFQFQAVLELAL